MLKVGESGGWGGRGVRGRVTSVLTTYQGIVIQIFVLLCRCSLHQCCPDREVTSSVG